MSELLQRYTAARESSVKERQAYAEKCKQATALEEEARRLRAEAFEHKRAAEEWDKAASSAGIQKQVEDAQQQAQRAVETAEAKAKEAADTLARLTAKEKELDALLAKHKE